MPRPFRTIEFKVSLYEIAPTLTWMRENGIPFLAKLRHQNAWTISRKSTLFFQKFKPEDRSARMRNGLEKPIILQLKFLRSDFPMVEMAIRLRWPTVKIMTPKRKKLPHPIGWKVKAVERS